MTDPIFLIDNKEIVKDKRTEFTGTVTARTEWSNGCIRYSVIGKAKDNKQPEDTWMDQSDLMVKRNGKWVDPQEVLKKKPREGIRPNPLRQADCKL